VVDEERMRPGHRLQAELKALFLKSEGSKPRVKQLIEVLLENGC